MYVRPAMATLTTEIVAKTTNTVEAKFKTALIEFYKCHSKAELLLALRAVVEPMAIPSTLSSLFFFRLVVLPSCFLL